MHHFKELRIWKDSMELSKSVYELTRKFPLDERFALTQQINRCVVSIPSNIAEGTGRNTKNDFRHFIAISLGSSFELETQLMLAGEFNYIEKNSLEIILTKLTSLQKMINKFRESLEQ
jgi:four helix bundle protein